MRIELHWAERFLNWYVHNTGLYIRGQRGKEWDVRRTLDKELFDALVPYLDKLKDEAYKAGLEAAATYVKGLPESMDHMRAHNDWLAKDIRALIPKPEQESNK